jgi:hypothetical protein
MRFGPDLSGDVMVRRTTFGWNKPATQWVVLIVPTHTYPDSDQYDGGKALLNKIHGDHTGAAIVAAQDGVCRAVHVTLAGRARRDLLRVARRSARPNAGRF